MRSIVTCTVAALMLLSSAVWAQENEHRHKGAHAVQGHRVPLYDNLGDLHHDISTDEPLAQQYFDQGLRWLYGFNHAASARSFEEGERVDPDCAMCAWGAALAYGPNINAPMDPENGERAYAAIQRALNRLDEAGPKERAFIEALAKRYAEDPTADRAPLDSAYARAMAEVAERYPDDLDAQVLYADALMNLSPWNYWTQDGAPRPGTEELIGRLLYAQEQDPEHPGACHLYIHAEEAHDPTKAVDCAERLAELMPGAGHIVHMPGHIYIRVGRYADAIEANKHAVHADESYLEGPHVSRHGIYPQGYYPHNYHFMSFAASMAGDSETAIYAARKVAEKVGPEVAMEIGWLEVITPIVYWTYVTFGRWDDILAEPQPPAELRFTTAQAYYARGVAHAAKGDWDKARTALDSVTAIAESHGEGDVKTTLGIARASLAGEMALRKGEAQAAVRHFRRAAELEASLTYNEPPTWYYSVAHSLGKALLEADRPGDAERVYRADLDRFPDNGWSLFGLYQSLKAQGKTEEAKELKARFEKAWKHADVQLTASRF